MLVFMPQQRHIYQKACVSDISLKANVKNTAIITNKSQSINI